MGRPGASSPSSAASSSSARAGTCWGPAARRSSFRSFPWVVGPLARSRGSSPCRAQRGKKKRAKRARFSLAGHLGGGGREGERGARGKGSGSHDGSMVPARQLRHCAPQRAGSPEVGSAPPGGSWHGPYPPDQVDLVPRRQPDLADRAAGVAGAALARRHVVVVDAAARVRTSFPRRPVGTADRHRPRRHGTGCRASLEPVLGRIPGGRGEALAAISAGGADRAGRSPGKTRPSRRGDRSEAWLMSPVSRSRGPGRRRRRRRLGPCVRGADRHLALSLGRTLDLAIAPVRPRRWRELIAARRGCDGRGSGAGRGWRGRPRLRHDLLDLGEHG